jgi:uncharacterized RDD family membrane protein YckC
LSDWEKRRKSSLCYYVCLILLLWPIFLFSIASFLSLAYIGFDAIIPFLLSTALILGLVFGLGIRYRYRGINPASRNMVNVNDGHYFERIGSDESDYP